MKGLLTSAEASRATRAAVLVRDGGPVAVLVGLVLHGLQAAVGQQHVVAALRQVAVPLLLVAELGAVLGRVHLVRELVLGRLLGAELIMR